MSYPWHPCNPWLRSFRRGADSKGTRRIATRLHHLMTPISARRFLAQALSLEPVAAGISMPKLTVWMRPASAPCSNKRFAHGAGAAVAQAAIVFGGAAFVGEAGDDNFAVLHEIRDLLNLAALSSANRLAVEIEIDRLKSSALHVAAEKGSALAPFRQRRAVDVIAGRARVRAAAAASFLSATGQRPKAKRERRLTKRNDAGAAKSS